MNFVKITTVMPYFYNQLKARLAELQPKMTFHQLHFKAEIGTSQFSLWKSGKRTPSDAELEKLANVPELGLSLNRLKGWRAIEQEGPEAVLSAIQDLERS